MDNCLASNSETGGVGCDNMTVIIIGLLKGKSKEEWYKEIADRVAAGDGPCAPPEYGKSLSSLIFVFTFVTPTEYTADIVLAKQPNSVARAYITDMRTTLTTTWIWTSGHAALAALQAIISSF